jgi:hypothetical protein
MLLFLKTLTKFTKSGTELIQKMKKHFNNISKLILHRLHFSDCFSIKFSIDIYTFKKSGVIEQLTLARYLKSWNQSIAR